MAAVNKGDLPVAKGIAFTLDDRIRARVIEMIMCDFRIDTAALEEEFGDAADKVIAEAEAICRQDRDGLLVKSGNDQVIPEPARPFARSVAARFDTYLETGKARHSSGV